MQLTLSAARYEKKCMKRVSQECSTWQYPNGGWGLSSGIAFMALLNVTQFKQQLKR